jgi:hypothetical protein
MATMTVNGPNVKIKTRSRIAVQNIMEGDEFLMRGEPSIFVEKIVRNEQKNTVTVSFDNDTRRRYTWGAKVSINETRERNAYRRNSLRRNGYPNYFDVLEEQYGC